MPQEHNILLSCAHHGEGDSHTGQKEEEKHDRTSSKRTSREQEKAERSAGSKGTEKSAGTPLAAALAAKHLEDIKTTSWWG